MVFILLTNILKEQSQVLCAGNGARRVLQQAFSDAGEDEPVILRGVVSRKKQFVPEVIKALQENE
jgi:manganese-dependent inorganic pyrophosphatase